MSQVTAMVVWDADGAGPTPPRLVVGGPLVTAGNKSVNGLATWDPLTRSWSPFPSIFGNVQALAVSPAGELVAIGDATGTTQPDLVARWNGTAWVSLGTTNSLGASLSAVAVLPSGDVVVAGTFTTMGGTPVTNLARWDGASWSSLGAAPNAGVYSLAVMSSGDLVAGGAFTAIGGVAAARMARWNGTSWSAMGSPPFANFSPPWELAELPNGDVVACGSPSGLAIVARWDGASWTTLGTGTSTKRRATALAKLSNGDVVVGGSFDTMGGAAAANIARWDGSSWSAIGTGLGGPPLSQLEEPYQIYAIVQLPDGTLVAAGRFQMAGSVPTTNIARWDGASWLPLGDGITSTVEAVSALPNGDLVAGGRFKVIGATTVNGIARWDGASWLPMGSGTNGHVNATMTLPNGDLLAAGSFSNAGGVATHDLARWDGTAWSAVPGFANLGFIEMLAMMPNGDWIAGGNFNVSQGAAADNIARWNGSSWSSLGSATDTPLAAMTVWNGEVVIGTGVTMFGGVVANGIARFDGTSWHPLGSGIDILPYPIVHRVMALTSLPNGDLVAGGIFNLAGGVLVNNIARWNGSTWSPLGSGMNGVVFALTTLPSGDLVAGGSFTTAGGVPANRIARWDGTTWSPIGQGVASGIVYSLTTVPNGDLMVAGAFDTAGGFDNANLARLTTTCPASATSYGTGCTGPGGQLSLVVDSLPWAGSTFEVTASGLGAGSVGMMVLSLGQILPGVFPINPNLIGIVPGPGVGCDLLVASIDYSTGLLPVGGVATWALPLTPVQIDPTLPGMTFHLQLAELDFSAGWIGTYVTNGVTCTVGAF